MASPVTVSADCVPMCGREAGGGTGGHSIRLDLDRGGVLGGPGNGGKVGREAGPSGPGSGSATDPREDELMAPTTLDARGGTMVG